MNSMHFLSPYPLVSVWDAVMAGVSSIAAALCLLVFLSNPTLWDVTVGALLGMLSVNVTDFAVC